MSEESKTDRASVEGEEPKVVDTDLVGDAPSADPPSSPLTRAVVWCRQHLVATVAVGLVLASAIAAASVYWWVYRPDRLTDAAAREQVVGAAKVGTEALLTYSPENLDADLANAKSHLTGDFLSYYTDFTDKVVAPASRDKGVKTEANVARAAVSQIRPGRADVLVFVNQVTTSKERPTPALSTSSVMVTLVQSGGHWLISGFNPV
jgi:Mce-associated membrane protein